MTGSLRWSAERDRENKEINPVMRTVSEYKTGLFKLIRDHLGIAFTGLFLAATFL
jgi:hypothetical protein